MRLAILCTLLVALTACDRAPPHTDPGDERIEVAQRMSAMPDPGFARALAPRPFVFPDDHGPHPAFATEWWYLTGNLRDADDRPFGYQLTLFRIGLRPGPVATDSGWRANQVYMGHLAISDIGAGRHHSAERLARAAAGLAGGQAKPLRIWLGPWSIEGGADDPFPLHLEAQTAEIAIDLQLEAGEKPLVLQGDQGLSRKGAAPGNASYYYSYTRLPTTGTLRIGEDGHRVRGDSWLDREWSSSALAPDQAGWDWFALQLDDGRELMFYQLRGRDGRPQRFSRGVLVAADGTPRTIAADEAQALPMRHWRSPHGIDYPVAWRLSLPGLDLDLRVEAALDAQEMDHSVRYWEGAVRVSGSHTGVGYLELAGYGEASPSTARAGGDAPQ